MFVKSVEEVLEAHEAQIKKSSELPWLVQPISDHIFVASARQKSAFGKSAVVCAIYIHDACVPVCISSRSGDGVVI